MREIPKLIEAHGFRRTFKVMSQAEDLIQILFVTGIRFECEKALLDVRDALLCFVQETCFEFNFKAVQIVPLFELSTLREDLSETG